MFQSVPYLIVSGGVDIENIMRFLENNQKKCIVITTYSSSHKVYTATQHTKFVFGMKILDEVHHLTTNNMRLAHTTKKYIQMLNIPSVKQLSFFFINSSRFPRIPIATVCVIEIGLTDILGDILQIILR